MRNTALAWSIFACNPICQVGFWVKDKRPIIGCFSSLKCLLNCSPRENQLVLKYLCPLAPCLGLYTDIAKFHPIWFPVLFPAFICNGGTQTGQPRLRVLNWVELSIYSVPHLLLISGSRSKAEPPQSSARHTITWCSEWPYSSSGWSSWHYQSLRYLHRFVWLLPSHLSQL